MMLGTNDAKSFNWNRREYHNDYVEMAKIMKNLSSKPEVYIMVPPPLYQDGVYQMQQKVINDWFPLVIREIAWESGIKQENVIDIFNTLGGAKLSAW